MKATQEQIAEAVRAMIGAPETVDVRVSDPNNTADPGRWLAFGADLTATGSWYVEGEDSDGNPSVWAHVEILTQFESAADPTDDAIVSMQDAMEGVDRQWHDIKRFIDGSVRHGDPSFAMEARSLLPALMAGLGAFLGLVNKAIEQSE